MSYRQLKIFRYELNPLTDIADTVFIVLLHSKSQLISSAIFNNVAKPIVQVSLLLVSLPSTICAFRSYTNT